MVLTISEVRECLSDAQNARYFDYQIANWSEWWNHKKTDVLKTINEQPINENRVTEILSDPHYRTRIISELNRRCLNVYHIPDQNRLVVFIYSRNKPPDFILKEAADTTLMFLYYVQYLLETLLHPGAKAEVVIDMLGGPNPTMAELKAQISMFSDIVSRTFPKLYGELILCCDWNVFFRMAVMALGHAVGLSALVLTPEELQQRYTNAYVPTVMKGLLDLNALESAGDQVDRFFANGGDHRTFPALITMNPPLVSDEVLSISSTDDELTLPTPTSPTLTVTPCQTSHISLLRPVRNEPSTEKESERTESNRGLEPFKS